MHFTRVCYFSDYLVLQEFAVLSKRGSDSETHVNWIRLLRSARNSKHVFAIQQHAAIDFSSFWLDWVDNRIGSKQTYLNIFLTELENELCNM